MAFTDATVKIDFATAFDGRALDRGTKQVDAFSKTLIKSAKALTGIYSATQLVRFARNSINAANSEIKAQQALATQLKNVGLGYETIASEKWINTFQRQTGILDDELRPAYAQLARVTGNVFRTQDLMNLAFDTAAGAGISYASAVDVISQAYVGNYRGLKQLNLGLSQTQIKSMSVNDILDVMKQKFDGAGAATVTMVDVMKTQFADINEIVGTALIKGLGGSETIAGVNDLTQAFKDMAPAISAIGYAARWSVVGIGKLVNMPVKWWKDIQEKWTGGTSGTAKASVITKELQKQNKLQLAALDASTKAIKVQTTAAKTLTAQQQKTVALQKLSNILRQAQKVFDNEAITLAAAAQGKLTEEERARLKLKQDIYDLEAAIAADNVAQATKIAGTLLQDAQLLGSMRTEMLNLSGVPDPFEAWLQTLKEIISMLGAMPLQTIGLATRSYAGGTSGTLGSAWQPETGTFYNPYNPNNDISGLLGGSIGSAYDPNMGGFYNPYMNTGSSVNIQINPAVAGLIDVIQDQSASGISPTVSRTNSSYIA